MNKIIPITTLTALIAFGPTLLGQNTSTSGHNSTDDMATPTTQMADDYNKDYNSNNKDWKDNKSHQDRMGSKDHQSSNRSDSSRDDSLRVTQGSELMGYDVFDSQGHKVGDITDFVVNLKDGSISHVIVSSGNWFSQGLTGENRIVPASAISRNGDRFQLSLTKSAFMKTPTFEGGDLNDIAKDVKRSLKSAYADAANNMQASSSWSRDRDHQQTGMRSEQDRNQEQQMAEQQRRQGEDVAMENKDWDRDTKMDQMHDRMQDNMDRMQGNQMASQDKMDRSRTQNRSSQWGSSSDLEITEQTHILYSDLAESEMLSASDSDQVARVRDALINVEKGEVAYILVDEEQVFVRSYPNDIVAVPMGAFSSRDGEEVTFNIDMNTLDQAEQVDDVSQVKRKGGQYSDVYVIRNVN